jgi:carbon-monoxide dehydrogenase small subunit
MAAQSDAVSVSIAVNGTTHETTVAPHQLLVDFLRDTLGLTGTKVGCETGQCGACIVLVDGASVKSCAMLAAQADGAKVTTIEGVAAGESLTPLQTALWNLHGVQCGFCAPAMVMSLTDLLSRNAKPDAHEIRRWMDGILCRCGVYQNAVRAVQSLAETK